MAGIGWSRLVMGTVLGTVRGSLLGCELGEVAHSSRWVMSLTSYYLVFAVQAFTFLLLSGFSWYSGGFAHLVAHQDRTLNKGDLLVLAITRKRGFLIRLPTRGLRWCTRLKSQRSPFP